MSLLIVLYNYYFMALRLWSNCTSVAYHVHYCLRPIILNFLVPSSDLLLTHSRYHYLTVIIMSRYCNHTTRYLTFPILLYDPLFSPCLQILHWMFPTLILPPSIVPQWYTIQLSSLTFSSLSFVSLIFIQWVTPCLVYRIHWLRAKARYDRSREDVCLLRHEMTWTINYFVHRSSSWQALSNGMDPTLQPGHIAYASQQMLVWTAFADKARVVFSVLLESDPFASLD